MGRIRSYLLTFVLGFGSCALAARLLLPVPVSATSAPAQSAADIVARVGDSVVSLEAYAPDNRLPDWRHWLGGGEPPAAPAAVASGVIVSERGFIVTNDHVVAGAGRLRVRLKDGREFNARIVGRDTHSDLSVLKIPGRRLKAAQLGESRRLRPGDPVVAIGNPLGFENSVTVGVLSAVRAGPIRVGGQVLGDLLQTDAAINQGNSGGGLFDTSGALVGINSAIMIPRGSSGSIGIGFAIPAHRVRPVIAGLIARGRIHRPWIGIRYQNAEIPEQVRLRSRSRGVLIQEAVPGSPAEQAGLRPGDLLLEVDGRPIRTGDDLYSLADRYQPGEEITVRILRGGARKTLRLTLGQHAG